MDYEGLKKLKELLDAGIITQAEYETKREELLNAPDSTTYTTASCSANSSYAANALQAAGVNRLAAGILAIVLGSLGIHKFYLGYTTQGVITLLISLLTFGVGAIVMEIIGIIEGIKYLTANDEQFYLTYVANQKPWF